MARFSIEAIFKAIDKTSAPVSRIQNRIQKFTHSAKRNVARVGSAFKKMNAGIKKGAVLATGALIGMGVAMKDLIFIGADFGRAIGIAAIKFPEDIKRGTAAFKELKDAAKEIGLTTEFTATQAANALKFMAVAGWSARFSIKALPAVVNFATAQNIELAEAADIASDALGAFGLNSKDLTKRMAGLNRVMDVMGKASDTANMSIGQLFESVRGGAGTTTMAGGSIETFSTLMGSLASKTIKAEKAGTDARRMMLSLMGVGNKAQKTFDDLGIALDVNGKLRDQLDVLDDLRKSLAKMTQKKRGGILEAIFGARAITSVGFILSDTNKQLREYRKNLERADGYNRITSKFIRDDMKGSLDSLTSSIEAVKLSIFELKGGPLKGIVDGTTDWIRANKDLIATRVAEYIERIIKGGKFLIKHGETILKVAVAYTALALAVKAVSTAMALFTLLTNANPIVLLISGITLVITGLVLAIRDLMSEKSKIKEAFSFGFLSFASGITGQAPPTSGSAPAPQTGTTTTERSLFDFYIHDKNGNTEVKQRSGPKYDLAGAMSGATRGF